MQLYFQQQEMIKFCEEENIVLTSYGPLGSPGRKDVPSM